MAEIQRKQTKYMTRAEFNALDKTTIPVGTEINIVDQIQKEDLSTDLQNAITSAEGALPATGGTVAGDLVVSGNLTVNGTTTTVESTTLKVKDKLIEVASDNTVALTTPAGLVAPKYDGTNSGALVFDAAGTAYVGDVALSEDGNIDVQQSDLQPLATRNLSADDDGKLVKWDEARKTLVASTENSISWRDTAPSDASKVLMTKVLFTSNDITNPLRFAYGLAPGYCNVQMETTINCTYFETNSAEQFTYGMLSGAFTYSAGQDVEVQFSGLFLRKQFTGESVFQATAEEMKKFTATCDLLYLW